MAARQIRPALSAENSRIRLVAHSSNVPAAAVAIGPVGRYVASKRARGRSGSSRTETYRTSSPSRRDRIRAWTYGRWKANRAPRTVGHDIASRLRNQTPGRRR